MTQAAKGDDILKKTYSLVLTTLVVLVIMNSLGCLNGPPTSSPTKADKFIHSIQYTVSLEYEKVEKTDYSNLSYNMTVLGYNVSSHQDNPPPAPVLNGIYTYYLYCYKQANDSKFGGMVDVQLTGKNSTKETYFHVYRGPIENIPSTDENMAYEKQYISNIVSQFNNVSNLNITISSNNWQITYTD